MNDKKQQERITPQITTSTLLEQLKRNKLEHDSDLVSGEREPYKYVLFKDEIPDKNLLLFVIRRFSRILYEGVKIYLPIHLLPIILFKRKQIIKEPKTVLWGLIKNQFKSSLFIASLTEGFLATVAVAHALNFREHPFVIYLAGFLCGLSCLWEQKSRRKELTIYCGTRAIDILTNFAQVRDWIKNIDYLFLIIFSFSMGSQMYYYHREQKHIKPFIRAIMSTMFGY